MKPEEIRPECKDAVIQNLADSLAKLTKFFSSEDHIKFAYQATAPKINTNNNSYLLFIDTSFTCSPIGGVL